VPAWKRETGRPIEQWTSPSTPTSSASATAPALHPANPLEVELKLLKRVPEEFRLHAHHWLILHGRYTCKARKPNAHAAW
jgi:hypothetical protein